MHRNKSVNVHQFAMIPKSDIPRSKFDCQSTHKTTFDAGYLVPVYVDEMLPGDTFNLNMTAFARLATPLYPIMDNMILDSFFFFVPNRLIWSHWQQFMGQQANPGDSISYVVPQQVSPAGGYAIGSLQDYMGLPTVGQVAGTNTVSHCAFWTRGYNLIWNEWFRDENLQNSVVVDTGDGPDNVSNYTLLRRGKRKDYFTSALPWTQKGNPVSLPLGTSAPVLSQTTFPGNYGIFRKAADGTIVAGNQSITANSGGVLINNTDLGYYDPHGSLYADLSQATASTINQIRQSFQIQKLLERDARGGTRYTEIVRCGFA
jgi:hypothetical protein